MYARVKRRDEGIFFFSPRRSEEIGERCGAQFSSLGIGCPFFLLLCSEVERFVMELCAIAQWEFRGLSCHCCRAAYEHSAIVAICCCSSSCCCSHCSFALCPVFCRDVPMSGLARLFSVSSSSSAIDVQLGLRVDVAARLDADPEFRMYQ